MLKPDSSERTLWNLETGCRGHVGETPGPHALETPKASVVTSVLRPFAI